MEYFLLFVFLTILYFIFRKPRKRPSVQPPSSSLTKNQKIYLQNQSWLEARWARITAEKASGKIRSASRWYFEDWTDRQKEKLDSLGIRFLDEKAMPKGQASDVIGLFYPLDEEDRKVLQFFKVPIKGFNQTRGREEVKKIFLDEEKRKQWNNRPAEPFQKEFFRFFNLKVPKGLTYPEAEAIKDEHLDTLSEEKVKEWEALEELWEEVNDPEMRIDYGVKKISVSEFREAIELLQKGGKTILELHDEPDLVWEQLEELQEK